LVPRKKEGNENGVATYGSVMMGQRILDCAKKSLMCVGALVRTHTESLPTTAVQITSTAKCSKATFFFLLLF
jgi:hypothetical protein